MTEVRRYRRKYVGAFMDENTATFGKPLVISSWVEYFEREEAAEGSERAQIEKAVNMFTQIYRQAQHAALESFPMKLEEFLCNENFPGLEEAVQPDPVALLLVGGDDPHEYTPEVLAFAQTMSIFKFLVNNGVLQADTLANAMSGNFDEISSGSPLQKSLVETVKQIAQHDMEMMLRSDESLALH